MKTVRDPKGNELKLVLVQVLSSDERGPVLLQVRRDDEHINLDNTPEHQRNFLMLWAPDVGKTLADDDVSKLLNDFETLKELWALHEAGRQQMGRDMDNLSKRLEEMAADDKVKTEELRKLHRERDPDRLNILIKEAVAEAVAGREAAAAEFRGTIAEQISEIRELKESKRRLKEANARLKKELEK